MEYNTSSSTIVTAAGFIIITAALLQANRHSVLAVPFFRQTRQAPYSYPLHEQVFNGLKIFTEVAKHTLQLDTLNEANLPLCDEVSYIIIIILAIKLYIVIISFCHHS